MISGKLKKVHRLAALVYALCLWMTTPVGAQLFTLGDHFVHHQELSKQFHNYRLLHLNDALLEDKEAVNSTFQFDMQAFNHVTWSIDVEENKTLIADMSVFEWTPNGKERLAFTTAQFFKGHVLGQKRSDVRLSIHENEIDALIRIEDNMFALRPLKHFVDGAPANSYLLYNANDIRHPRISCGMPDQPLDATKIEAKDTSPTPLKMGCARLEMAVALDFATVAKHGSAENAINHVLTVLNMSEADYTGFFNDDIEYAVTEMVVSTCAECDPWTDSDDPLAVLNDFADWGQNEGFQETFELGQFWSARAYQNGIAGLAFQGQLCGLGSYNVVRDIGNDLALKRAIVSHEMGHNFNCFHNYELGDPCDGNPGRNRLIMDPIVFATATAWSTGSEPCALNSTASVNTALAASTCLDACVSPPCQRVSNLQITNVTQSGFTATWTGSASNYRVRVRKEGGNTDMADIVVSTAHYVYTGVPLDLCFVYEITIESICASGPNSLAVSSIFSTSFSTKFDIVSIETMNCFQGNPGSYDLVLTLEHGGGAGSTGFEVVIDGTVHPQTYTSGAQQVVTIYGLPTSGQLGIPVLVRATGLASPFCEAYGQFDAPNGNCDLRYVRSFDNCALPSGWVQSSTNTMGFSDPFDWKFDDSDRAFQNYDDFNNATSLKTINGSCMAYLDDDITPHSDYTGTITMTTDVIDLSIYLSAALSFDYNFHNFEEGKSQANNSIFTVEAFDGSNWQTLLTDETDECPWWDVWQSSCTESFSMDISAFMNSLFQVRFTYSDGGDGLWTGMIAMDDFLITAVRGSTVPVQITDFTGRIDGRNAVLEWHTAQEVDMQSYHLEKSEDGRHFRPLTTLNALNKPTGSIYQFVDEAFAPGTSLYRLSALDRSGQRTFYGAIALSKEGRDDFVIYPRLITSAHVTIANADKHRIEHVSLTDVSGRVLQQWKPMDDDERLALTLHDIPTGVFFLHIRSTGNTPMTQKVVVM